MPPDSFMLVDLSTENVEASGHEVYPLEDAKCSQKHRYCYVNAADVSVAVVVPLSSAFLFHDV